MPGKTDKPPASSTIEIAVLPDRKIIADVRMLNVDDLKLDPKNVRFKHLQTVLSDSAIEDIIWEEDDTRQLYREIVTSRGLTEPPLVDFDNTVKEGNRRLVCLRKIRKDARAGKLKDIKAELFDKQQCYVLPENTPDKAIALYLARIHVSGKKEWPALNQAAYLWELYENYKLDYEDLRNYLSMGKATVIRKVASFKSTMAYGEQYSDKDQEWIYKFSYFEELYKNKDLKEWASKDGNIKKFQEWIFTKRLPDPKGVRDLPEIMNNKSSLSEFESATPAVALAKALSILSKDDPSKTSNVYSSIKSTMRVLREMPREEFVQTIRDSARLKMLEDLRDAADGIIKDVEALKTSKE